MTAPAAPEPPPLGLPLVVAHAACSSGAAPAVVHRIIADPPTLAQLEARYGPNFRTVLLALADVDPSLQRVAGGAASIPPSDWVAYPGAALVLAAFTYPPALGLPAAQFRFSNGGYGVWYAADTLTAAQAEVGHHMAQDFAAGRLGLGPLARRVVSATLSPVYELVDLRGLVPPPDVRHPTDYAEAQQFGAACRVSGQWGVLWESVRCPPDLCVGILRPPAVTSAWLTPDACTAEWDGRAYRWGGPPDRGSR